MRPNLNCNASATFMSLYLMLGPAMGPTLKRKPTSKQSYARRDEMKIVVLAHENDNHTAPIKWAAEQAGYKVACWGGLAPTEKQQASASFNGTASMTLGPHAVDPGDVVWIRRPQPSEINPKVSESEDRKSVV